LSDACSVVARGVEVAWEDGEAAEVSEVLLLLAIWLRLLLHQT